MAMPGRTYSPNGYRYGFNGKENDKDISEGGQDYGMRIYDSRIGRFLSVDPLTPKYPELTPYQFASNSPMENSDLDGLESLSEIKSGLARQQEMRMRIPQLNLINAQKEAAWFRAMLNTYSQIPPSTFSKAPLYSASEQEKNDAFRAYKLSEAGYNADGTLKPLTQLAENKTFNKFADNIGLPIAEQAIGDGAATLTVKLVGSLIRKGITRLVSNALIKDVTIKGALQELEGEAGVYIHEFNSGKGYVGQAENLAKRPKESLKELLDLTGKYKGTAAKANDVYSNVTRFIKLEGSGFKSLNELENAVLQNFGGTIKQGGNTYNIRRIPIN